MTETVSWGIIGCGDVTEVKSGPALARAPRSRLHAVMRRDGAKARDYAQRHGAPKAYDSVDALLADDAVTAVYVATPPSSHKDLAVRALESGRPVLVEKPMALDAEECAAMTAAAARTGRTLTVAYYRRALPRFERLREIVRSGALGAPRAIEVRHRMTTETSPPQDWKRDAAVNGGGFFVDIQAHTLDWLSSVFGPPEAIGGEAGGDGPVETAVAFAARFPGDVVATGSCVYDATTNADRVTIIGTGGEVSMPFFRAGPIKLRVGTSESEELIPDPPHVHEPLVTRMIAALLDGAPNPCDGEAGAQATRMIDAILANRRSR